MTNDWQLIILDRDGVINNDSDDYIKSADEWQALPGSLEAIAEINALNIPLVVCTNQSGIARKLFDLTELNAMHDKLQRQLAEHNGHIDKIYFCPHHPDDNCQCRKPKPGMMQQALADFNAEPDKTLLIGDSLKDIQAAHAAGCHAALVKTGKGQRTIAAAKATDDLAGIKIYADLATAVDDLAGN